MESRASCAFQKNFDLQFQAEFSQAAGNPDNIPERSILGIEIDNTPVWVLNRFNSATPDMKGNRPQIYQVKQRIKVIAEEKVASPCLSFFPNLSSSHPGRNIVGHILLKKGLSVDAVRVSVENNRPATKVGKYPVTDRPVILDEITFGNPIVRPKHLVGITDAEFWRFSGVS